MQRINIKPDLMNTKAVKVWTQAGIERLSEREISFLCTKYWQNGRANEFP